MKIGSGEPKTKQGRASALLLAILVTVCLLLITGILAQTWKNRLIENTKHRAEHALLQVRKNLYLLLGSEQTFTAFFAQRLEEDLQNGTMFDLSHYDTYLQFLRETQSSFVLATIMRQSEILDFFPKTADGLDPNAFVLIPEHLAAVQAMDTVVLDGPIRYQGASRYFVCRTRLDEGGASSILLNLYFDFDRLMQMITGDALSDDYQYFMVFSHVDGQATYEWGDPAVLDSDAVTMDVSVSMLGGTMSIAPKQPWMGHSLPLLLYTILGAFVSCSIGFVIYHRHQRYLLLQERIHRDGLTNLLNRKGFEEVLRHALAEDFPFALALLDVDNFKQINDTYGHLIGDQALLSLVEQCNRSLAATDTLARYGGDEFIFLFRNCATQELCKALHQSISQAYFRSAGISFPMVVSMGVSFFPREGDTYEGLFNLADQRLYRAKQEGKGRLCTE